MRVEANTRQPPHQRLRNMAMASYSEDIQEFLIRDRERISSFNDGSGTIVEDGSPIFRRSRDVSTFNCDNDNKRRMYDEDSGSSLRKAELNGEGNTEAFTSKDLIGNKAAFCLHQHLMPPLKHLRPRPSSPTLQRRLQIQMIIMMSQLYCLLVHILSSLHLIASAPLHLCLPWE